MAKRKTTTGGAEIHRPRKPRGLGIAMKFAMPVSIATILVVGVLGFTVHSNAKTALNDQINSAGVFAAAALAAPDWQNEDNTKRLGELLTQGVEEVVIWEKNAKGEDVLVANATNRDELPITHKEDLDPVAGTKMTRGELVNADGKRVPYRSFRKSIFAPDNQNKAIAAVQVFLSEEKIESELDSITQKIILFSVLGIALGLITCFAVAGTVTKPLQRLIGDIRAVAGGNLQHRTKPHSKDEIGVLAETFDEMTRGLEEAVHLREDLSSKEHDEHIAQEIQEKLFPAELPAIPDCSVDAVYEAAGEISSDLFDFLDLEHGRTGLLVLSASGRGVPAAIVLAMARSVFRAVAPGIESPAEALRRINALFSPDLRRGMYVTACYAIYDESSHAVTVASAGHQMPVLHHDAERDALGRVHPGGIAMGLDKGPVFDRSLEETSFEVTPGSTVLLGTGGVFGLKLKSGEEVGDQRFFKAALGAMKARPEIAARHLVEKIDANLADDAGEFDVTVVSIHRSDA